MAFFKRNKTEHDAWWRDEQPRKQLPEELQRLLDQDDPEFIEQLKKYAYECYSSYRYDPGRGYHVWVGRDGKKSGSWLWTLYLHPNPLAKQGLRELLWYHASSQFNPYSQGYNWEFQGKWKRTYTFIPFRETYFRYVKAIYKLAEKRRDAETWALLACRFDSEKASTFYYQNKEKQWTHGFSSDTRHYLRRRAWRTLRNLGKAGSPDYVRMATEVLLRYMDCENQHLTITDPNTSQTKTIHTYTHLWLFNHILYHNSSRFTYHGSTQWRASEDAYTQGIPERREEAFPELWDQYPEQLWRLVQKAYAAPVIQFAGRALRLGNHDFICSLKLEELKLLLTSKEEARREVAAAIMLDRLDPNQPDLNIWLSLAMSSYPEVREQAKGFLRKYVNNWSEEQTFSLVKAFIGLLQSEENLANEIIEDWVNLLQHELKHVLYRIATVELAQEFARIPYPSMQELALLILSQIDVSRTPMKADHLLPFLQSTNPTVVQAARQLLIERYTQLQITPQFLAEFASIPGEEHQVFATQFFTDRILWLVPFMPELISECWVRMLRSDLPEDVRDYLREHLLGSLFWSELKSTPLDKILLLLSSDSTALQEFGARLLQLTQPDPSQLSLDQLLGLAHSPVALVRSEARNLIIQERERITDDWMVNLVETDWDDTRNWMFEYMKTLSSADVSPELIYGLLDSARTDVQQFAMQMAEIHFHSLDQIELMLRASESPYLHVQQYTLELAKTVKWNGSLLERMELFFRTILFRVNEGRTAKKMAMELLLHLGEEKREFAEKVVPILADLARNGGKKEFERILFALTRIQSKYPEIHTPLQVG